MKEISGSSVLILGYGKEGQSAHRHLLQHHPDKTIGVADKHPIASTVESPVRLHLGDDYLESIPLYDVVVRSPGVPSRLPKLREAKHVTSATNIFFSECPGTIIGVTGTKGKSTAAALIHHILKQTRQDVRFVGNIGNPALDYLEHAARDSVFVMELSSYQLEDIHYNPHIAVMLAITPEHLDHHLSFGQYVKAKEGVVRHQTSNDIVIFNPVHLAAAALAEQSQAKKYRFSISPQSDASCWRDNQAIYVTTKHSQPQFVMSTDDIPLLGSGNLENCLAAISVAAIMDVPVEQIGKAVAEFQPLEHRLEPVGEVAGIRFYNDSLATTPEATIHALEALGEEVETLIAGGFDRGLDYSAFGKFLAQREKLKNLILFPDTGKRILAAMMEAGVDGEVRIRTYEVSSMPEAVVIAFESTSAGKVCLMSPASASFNLFADYKERGELFKKLVLEH